MGPFPDFAGEFNARKKIVFVGEFLLRACFDSVRCMMEQFRFTATIRAIVVA